MLERELRQRFSDEAKMGMVAESWELSGESLGRYMRARGISSSELESWRAQMKDGLEDGKPLDRGAKRKYESEIRRLEKEVAKLRATVDLLKKSELNEAEAEAKREASKSARKSSTTFAKRKRKV